ncbi:cadherin-like domain-containing protein [Mesorhizobium sp. LHD-90]|uniref:cadherin-like domain-containing protein n=1 Tax=Mesorhizobium sp. LHD-90 TaxID=3071414 RepID=UPI0027DEDD47|nr:cadherin-like domain-containing protein [Mesorhizobium sp. LHD-90]MDQ6434873.1 cadherin-like domain-containing protein [Mesorhizobium sp. LHD-90]
MPSRIFFTTQAGATDTFLTSANVDGTNVVSQVADATPGSPWQETVIDAANNRYYILQHSQSDDNAVLYTGQLNSSAAPTVAFTFETTDLVRGLEIDPVNHRLFIGRVDFDASQTTINNAATGLLQIDYNPATGAVSNTSNFLVTQVTDPLPSGFILTTDIARDDGDGTLYFAQATVGAGTNMIYRVDTSNNITTLLNQSQFPTNFTNGFIADVDVDAGRNQVYFSTFAQPFGAGPTNRLWVISDTATGSTNATAVTLAGMPGGATFIPGDFTIDQATHQLYVESEENPGAGNSDDLIYRFQLSADGLTATFLNVIDPPLTTANANIGGIEFVGNVVAALDLDANNSAGIGGSGYQATFTEGAAAVAIADTDTTIADDGATIASATVTLTNHQAGDLLSVSGVLPGGVVASAYDAGTGVLTLTGSTTLANYQAALQQLRFSNSSDAPNTTDRGITVTINDGEANSNTATATIHVTATNDAPALTGDLSATLGEGGSYVITAADLDFIDPDDAAAGVTFTVSNQVNGTVLVNGGAATTFTGAQLAGGLVGFLHDGSEGAAASFSVSVEDGNEDGSAPAASTFNFTVNAVDDAGVAHDDLFPVDEATGIAGGNVFSDNHDGADSDPDSALVVAKVNGVGANVGTQVTLASGALLTLNADGTLVYDLNGKFNDLPGPASGASNLWREDTFTYTLADGDDAKVFVRVYGLDSDGDILKGTAGADTFAGGIGSDTYQVDNVGDTVTELAGEGTADRVLTSVSFALGAGQEVEFLETADPSGTTALILRGNTLGQTIEGNDGDNVLHDGGTGPLPDDGVPDTLIGRDGNDTYTIYDGAATIVEAAGEGVDRLCAGVDYVLASGVSVERLNTTSLFATYSVDLTGNELVQLVRGNNGANTLDGGGGKDLLFGMGGADDFRFSTALGPTNIVRIADFVVADDTIQLDDAIFTALAGPGALDPNAFKDTAFGPKDADDRIIYNSDTGALLYDADGSGTVFGNVRFATIVGSPLLTAADFDVV